MHCCSKEAQCWGFLKNFVVQKQWFTLGMVMAKDTTFLSFMTFIRCFKDPSFDNRTHESIRGAFSSANLGVYLNMEEE